MKKAYKCPSCGEVTTYYNPQYPCPYCGQCKMVEWDRKPTTERLAKIEAENNQMIATINHNIQTGRKYYTNTFLGRVEIGYITPDLWIFCPKLNGGMGRSFAIHGGELQKLYETGEIS